MQQGISISNASGIPDILTASCATAANPDVLAIVQERAAKVIKRLNKNASP